MTGIGPKNDLHAFLIFDFSNRQNLTSAIQANLLNGNNRGTPDILSIEIRIYTLGLGLKHGIYSR
jgi:hypothetical protein